MPAEKRPRVIETATEAIHALGGANFVAELFGIGPNAVRNWYKRGLPPETYSKLAPRLLATGCEFSDDLFRQYPVVIKPAKKRKDGGK